MEMRSPSALIHDVNCMSAARSTAGAHASLPPPVSGRGDATELKCAAWRMLLPKEARPSPTAPEDVNAFAGSVACEQGTARLCAHETSEHSHGDVQHMDMDMDVHMQHEACGAGGVRSGHHRRSCMPRA